MQMQNKIPLSIQNCATKTCYLANKTRCLKHMFQDTKATR